MKGIIFFFAIIKSLFLYSNNLVELKAPNSFNYGEKFSIEVSVKVVPKYTRIYFRYSGIEEYQVRDMQKMNGTYNFEIDTSLYASPYFEYYIEVLIEENPIYFPEGAPQNIIKIEAKNEELVPSIPQDFPLPSEEEKFIFPLDLNGDVEHLINEKEESEENKTESSGNIRIYPSYKSKSGFSAELDANFNMTSNPLPEEKKIDLSDMNLKFSKDNNSFNIGDLNISESEYSISASGRRGLNYLYQNQKAYINIFDISSQQPKGFDGFGIPKSKISIYGSAIGYNLFDGRLSLKTIYLKGKDNPNEGTNVNSSELYQAREGSIISFLQELKLFKNTFSIKSEYAKSKYDENLEDDSRAISDKAYKIGTSFSSGFFAFGLNYNYIGKDFNSIGYQYFLNNRKGYDSNINFNFTRFSLALNLFSLQDNSEDDPDEFTTKNKSGNLNILLNPTDKFSINFSLRKDKQKTYLGDEEVLGQDSITNEFSGSFSINLSQSSTLLFSYANSSLSSEYNPESESSTSTINIGGSFRKGNNFSLNPSIGYGVSKNEFTEDENKTFNIFLNGNFYFIPSILSLNISTGLIKNKDPLDQKTDTINATANLSFDLGNLVKKFQSVISINGSYMKNKTEIDENTDYKVYAQLSFSF